jgi:hypothetical protein
LALSTFGFLVVLAAAGGSRYAAALRTLAGQPQFNILGAEAEVDINPMRDVLISLLANVAAWAVGVFIAYLAHDQDPEYMEAAHERVQARTAFNHMRQLIDKQLEGIRAAYLKQISEKENAAKTRSRGVETERSLLLQVGEHEKAIVDSIQSVLLSNVELYRETLVQAALQMRGQSIFVRSDNGNPITPQEYKNTPLLTGELV